MDENTKSESGDESENDSVSDRPDSLSSDDSSESSGEDFSPDLSDDELDWNQDDNTTPAVRFLVFNAKQLFAKLITVFYVELEIIPIIMNMK